MYPATWQNVSKNTRHIYCDNCSALGDMLMSLVRIRSFELICRIGIFFSFEISYTCKCVSPETRVNFQFSVNQLFNKDPY